MKKRTPKTGAAFSLTEVLVTMLLMSLLFLVTTQIFLSTGRAVGKMRAMTNTTRSAGLVMQWLDNELHEAYGVILPTDTDVAWDSSQLGAIASYKSNRPSGAEGAGWASQLNTGIFILYPPAGAATLKGASGSDLVLSGGSLPVNRGSAAITRAALVFRGNPDGSVNPGYGNCLWVWRFEAGSRTETRLLTNELSSAWNAVYFRRQDAAKERGRGLVAKVVCGEKVYAYGEQTNERSDSKSKVTQAGQAYVGRAPQFSELLELRELCELSGHLPLVHRIHWILMLELIREKLKEFIFPHLVMRTFLIDRIFRLITGRFVDNFFAQLRF